jgi:cytoskeletal protein CcmA (bactofilin family)
VKLKSSKSLSIIDKELKIEGSISSIGQLIIKGQVTGTIEGDVVIIASEGRVSSTYTKVSSITIGGNFQGEIVASEELIILSTGSCAGKVEYKKLIVENGGILNAEVICKTDNKLLTENKRVIDKDKPITDNKDKPVIENKDKPVIDKKDDKPTNMNKPLVDKEKPPADKNVINPDPLTKPLRP